MNTYAFLTFLAAGVCFVMAYTVFDGGEGFLKRDSKPLDVLDCMVGIFYAVELLGMTGNNEASHQDLISGIVCTPVFLFLFSMAILDKREWFTWRRISLLFAVPVAVLVSMWTNEVHWLYYSVSELDLSASFPVQRLVHGPLFWFGISYSYVLLLLSIILIAQQCILSRGPYKGQLKMICLGVFSRYS
jgi:hypothetical protein